VEPVGLYIHVPFCLSKCPYCDFYSLPLTEESALDEYTQALLTCMDRWAADTGAVADTLYFGGGTPALLGPRRLSRLIGHAGKRFHLFDGQPEITLEANPADDLADTLSAFAAAGGNRLSLGMQSACREELAILGRRHTPADVERTVADAHWTGLENVSLDIMLGVSGQRVDSACASARRAVALGATHVSAYMLKVEPGTPYGACPPPLPDEDTTADMYLAVMDTLDNLGYRQYEISNAARPGYESRHNLKYWDSRPYLGLGPAASSCYGGRRFAYPRDLKAFLAGGMPLQEPESTISTGSEAEYALLRLRLAEGLTEEGFAARFGASIPASWRRQTAPLPSTLVQTDDKGIRLTREGFLLSNTLIAHILGK